MTIIELVHAALAIIDQHAASLYIEASKPRGHLSLQALQDGADAIAAESEKLQAALNVLEPDPDPDPEPLPVDCAVGEWGPWSDWVKVDATTEQRTRSRVIVTQPAHGGQECPSLTDTETRQIVLPPPPQGALKTSDQLHAALLHGGTVVLDPSGTFEGRFVIGKPTTIQGNGAAVKGIQGPALRVPPGSSDIVIENLVATSTHDQAVIQLGDNSPTTQTLLSQVPRRITIRNVTVPQHAGKRGIEVNAADVQILDCTILNVWHPAKLDSQAVWIHNTPGPVTVRGGRFSAGSEIIMSGGDIMKLEGGHNLAPSDLLFEDLTLFRPPEWRMDGVGRSVKNIFELKAGHRVTVRNVVMDGAWNDSQEGFAVMLTPSRNSVKDVLFEHVTIRNATGAFNIHGRDQNKLSDVRMSNVVIRDTHVVTDKSSGGRGILALIGNGPESVTFERVTAIIDGTSLMLTYGDFPVDHLTLTDSYAIAGKYGLFLCSNANVVNTSCVGSLVVTGNTFGGAASTMRSNLPENTYLSLEAFKALFDEKWQLKP